MSPVVVCTVGSPSINVLKSSLQTYAPDYELLIHNVSNSNFGESYNKALAEAFEKYDEVIISNDDIVITPTTIPTLLSDVKKLKDGGVEKIGFVAALADTVRPSQNVRYKFASDDEIVYGKWKSEQMIKLVPVIAPIFAWLPKEAFQVAQFPPINWYSDDVICDDLTKLGFKNFVSTSYVHHVGSSTIGTDYEKLRKEALPWIEKNRPDLLQELDNRRYTNKPRNNDTNAARAYYVRNR